MPAPLRTCETCKHYVPYKDSELLRETFGKCTSGKRPGYVNFAETCRIATDLCGPDALWWEPKPPTFEVVEDGPQELDWEDDDDDS